MFIGNNFLTFFLKKKHWNVSEKLMNDFLEKNYEWKKFVFSSSLFTWNKGNNLLKRLIQEIDLVVSTTEITMLNTWNNNTTIKCRGRLLTRVCCSPKKLYKRFSKGIIFSMNFHFSNDQFNLLSIDKLIKYA